MAYPVGVTTRLCTFSDPVDAEDASQEASRKRAIVACNDKIIHLATGTLLIPTPQIFTTDFSLPITDQVGVWGDGEGNSLSVPTHSYRVDLEYKTDEGQWIKLKTIKFLLVPTSGSDLDLDLSFDTLKTTYKI